MLAKAENSIASHPVEGFPARTAVVPDSLGEGRRVRFALRPFFFFSSRRRHTSYWRDWSSDVCSSDLRGSAPLVAAHHAPHRPEAGPGLRLRIIAESSRESAKLPREPTTAPRRTSDAHAPKIGRASCRKSVRLGGQRYLKKQKLLIKNT